ncbi:ubiquitin carboxyl-terminal hydrolase 21-like isoform X2 [Rhododendron vialii]|uniref:ubiquitin carboxyl-terminal hydrolase 21-like isoform X2 n=1 Tax=Rhododendron vialii TaxID=182163 RepID=UPI00265FEC0A|nr:ubiquitin carboxyl-terminal hydrolase 21-like isoform X2 [Rhododendron vialii]
MNAYESYSRDHLPGFLDESLDDESVSASVHGFEPQEDVDSSLSNTVSAFSPLHWPSAGDGEYKPLISVSPGFLSTEIMPAMVGAGLANLGNTCFLNAVLQCFTHTVPLIQGLWSSNHARPCDRDSVGFCVLCALRDHVELSLASMGTVVSPRNLVDNLSYISSTFRRFQQEDAHEFLQCLLDRLDSCCTYSESKDMAMTSEDENLVKQVFGGRLISKLRCCKCGHCSDTYEPLIDLSLEIENVDTLTSALESFTKMEKIEDPDMQFTCDECKERVSIEKQLILDQVPSVATFHLKRFKNDGVFVEKIDKYVEFPLELDLLPYTSGSQNTTGELKYDLYAVVVHTELSSTCGHYYCFVRCAQEVWYKFDDSKVARVGEDFVLSQEAYILFYAKQGTPWFSSFLETEKSYLDQYKSNHPPKSVLDSTDRIYTSSPNVTSNCYSEVKKAREEVVGVSVESFNGYINGVQGNEAKADPPSLFTPAPLVMSSSSNGTSDKVEKKFSPSVLKENKCNQEFNEIKNGANINLSMPLRSPSPDIYAEEAPVSRYSIPRDHLIPEKQVPCKRKLDEDLEDSRKKQAALKLLKNMPNYRSSKLLAAMNGSHDPIGKKIRRKELPSNSNRASSTSHKPNLDSFLRPVAAGSLH